MKYLLLSISLLIGFTCFADKKKSKPKTNVVKKTEESSSDGTMVTANTEMQTSDNYKNKLENTRIDAPLFAFKCSDIKNTTIDQDKFNDRNLVVMLYNPDCGHCMEVARKILEILPEHKDTRLLLMSGENTTPAIPEFMKTLGISEDSENITIALISKETTEAIFEYNGIPQVMVYGQERLLRKVYYKDIDILDFSKLLE